MTVPTTTNSVTYAGPQAMPLAIPYKFFQDVDLEVTFIAVDGTITTLVLTTDYTLTGAGQPSGGTLTLVAGAMITGESITILRAPAAVQNSSIPNGSRFFGSVLEAALDLLTMLVQGAASSVSRAVLFPLGEAGYNQEIPALTDRANKIAGWDGSGNWTELDTAAVYGSTNFIVDAFAAGAGFTPGSTTQLTLSQAPGTVNNLTVAFDGAYQQKSTFSLVGAVVTFDAAIPLGVLKVECVQAQVLPVTTLGNNTVGTAAIENDAVTQAKIADDAVGTDQIAPASVTLAQLAADALQGGRNGIINGCGNVANGTDYVASVSGTYGYGKSELCKGALVGTAVAGTLTRVTNSAVGRTGLAFRWSAMTVTGAGIAKFRFFIEAKDALKYKNQTVSVSGLVRHDTGASVNFAIVVSKADVADNFGATTVISTGPTIPVLSATNGQIYNRAISMGDCSNGIMVEITAAIGAVAGKLVDLTQVQLELGAVETDFEFEPYSVTQDKVRRCYQLVLSTGTSVPTASIVVAAFSTSHAYATVPIPPMRTAPAATLVGTLRLQPGAVAVTVSVAITNASAIFLDITDGGASLTAAGAYLFGGTAGITLTADARF